MDSTLSAIPKRIYLDVYALSFSLPPRSSVGVNTCLDRHSHAERGNEVHVKLKDEIYKWDGPKFVFSRLGPRFNGQDELKTFQKIDRISAFISHSHAPAWE